MMRRDFALLALATALAASTHDRPTETMRGVESVNVRSLAGPICARPCRSRRIACLIGGQPARRLVPFAAAGYGDNIYVDGADA